MFHELLKNTSNFEYYCILLLYRWYFWIPQVFSLHLTTRVLRFATKLRECTTTTPITTTPTSTTTTATVAGGKLRRSKYTFREKNVLLFCMFYREVVNLFFKLKLYLSLFCVLCFFVVVDI